MSRCYETRMSTRKRRQERITVTKEAKSRQNYEDKPPSCLDCAFRKVPQSVNKVYVPPFCGIGLFAVRAGGCCDEWTGHSGEKLL